MRKRSGATSPASPIASLVYRSAGGALPWIAVTALLLFTSISTQAAAVPELPRVFLNTAYAPPGGRILIVPAGGDFQATLDAARPGDIIELQAGATFTGNFILPNKAGTGWIYIRSSAHASLPPPGSRVSPADAGPMPKVVSPNILPAIRTASSAHHFRFVGIEMTTTHSVTTSTHFGVVVLEASGGQTSLSQVPTDIVFDRCYIHGTPTGNVRRGIAMNSARTAVVDSYLSDFHEVGKDSQAIGGWNGPGPFKIVNNYLEGAAENVMFGGGDPSIPDLVPSDIEIRHNHFFKPFSWRVGDPSYAGIHWSVKNLFELKNAQRVLVEGNIFENNWEDAQRGVAILFTVRNQSGGCPWCIVQDVTFIKNIVRRSSSGFNITGTDDLQASQRTKRILIKDNVLEDLDAVKYGSNGCNRMFLLINVASPNTGMPGGTLDLTIDHNTGFIQGSCPSAIFMGDSAADFNKHENFVFQNNIVQAKVGGTGTAEGINTLNTYAKFYAFVKNVLIGRPPSLYPVDNFFPTTPAAVGFVDLTGGDYHLSLLSPYNDAGTDRKDIGVDFDALLLATTGVIEGTGGAGSPPSGDTTPPVISAVAAPLITSSGATTTWTTDEASDSQVEFGTTTAYGSLTPLNPTLVTSHSQTLSGLAANTLYHYRVKSRDAAGNLAVSPDQMFTTLPPPQSPFKGTPFTVPALIEAEDFDLGGEGVAYHDAVAGNAGGLYRTSEDVDIVAAAGNATGYVVNNIQTGEWLEYTINVNTSGTYTVEAHVSNNQFTPRFHIEIDGSDVTGSISVPNTGDWNTFQWVGKSGISISAGQHVLRIHSDQDYFNLDAIRILETVHWTSLVNVTVSGTTIKKTSGVDGADDAGAVSAQTITSGNGYVEFTAPDNSTSKAVGLSSGNPGTSRDEIDFSWRLRGSASLEIRENGVLRWSSTYAAGDVFRVAVEGGVVRYYQNGVLRYTSTVAPTYPLLVDSSLLSLNATIHNTIISY